ncbi:MAG: preprotein translocase subunit SecE [Acidobacteriaceae bacterium]|nr:preprotein translocase subunit SecE [Acidobacteriaceae bacterium]MBV9295306.1 preprotein translocase subunit SecE [Acidobacteriaceae bacterium]
MELSKAVSWPQQTKSYIDEVKAEMKRVSWPSWRQVRATTGVVIAATFLFAAYFWVVDNIVNAAVSRVINYFSHH